MNKYYVYCYFDGDVPIYIGKGMNHRDKLHLRPNVKDCPRFHNKLHKMQREGLDPKPVRLCEDLTEKEAFNLECFLIRACGRKDIEPYGTLLNLTLGGDGLSGHRHTAETRQKLSVANMGKVLTDETRKKMSLVRTGKVASVETRQKLSVAQMGKVASAETRQKLSVVHTGIVASFEARHNMSVSRMGHTVSAETRQKLSVILWHKSPKYKFKGVHPRGKKWRAVIDDRYLGTCETPEASAQLYNDGVDKYHGGIGYKNQLTVENE